MKTWAPILLAAFLAAATTGCQSQQKPQTSASVLDVSGPSPRQQDYAQPVSGYQPTGQYAAAAPAQAPAANRARPTPTAGATTTTPPYMLPSAYPPPPQPMPATAVVETHAPAAQQQPAVAAAAAPPPQQPTRTRSAAKPAAAAPPVADAATASAGSRYTVRQGDTLYHIAKVSYGDGKQWQRIANANPGVSPTSLKVGQVLVVP